MVYCVAAKWLRAKRTQRKPSPTYKVASVIKLLLRSVIHVSLTIASFAILQEYTKLSLIKRISLLESNY